MRTMTAGLGVLTVALASALMTPPGQALFGFKSASSGPSLTVITDRLPAERTAPAILHRPARVQGGAIAGASAPSRPSREPSGARAAAVPAGAPSVRPLPTAQPAPVPSQSSTGVPESAPGMEQIARIANILLNLPHVLSQPQAHPDHGPQEESP
jgi:hypothetical protein